MRITEACRAGIQQKPVEMLDLANLRRHGPRSNYAAPAEVRMKPSVDRRLSLVIRNDLSEIGRVFSSVEAFGGRMGVPAKQLHDLTLALEEVIVNIVHHGYDADDALEHQIRIDIAVLDGELQVSVEDDGHPYNPLKALEPDVSKGLDERPVGGLGVFLVRRLTDRLEYCRDGSRNLLTMRKRIKED